MAIKKQIELNNGVIAEYWRIKNFIVSNASNTVKINLELWRDEATRQEDGKNLIAEYQFDVELDSSIGIVFSNCYDKLKLLEQFQGAVDV